MRILLSDIEPPVDDNEIYIGLDFLSTPCSVNLLGSSKKISPQGRGEVGERGRREVNCLLRRRCDSQSIWRDVNRSSIRDITIVMNRDHGERSDDRELATRIASAAESQALCHEQAVGTEFFLDLFPVGSMADTDCDPAIRFCYVGTHREPITLLACACKQSTFFRAYARISATSEQSHKK